MTTPNPLVAAIARVAMNAVTETAKRSDNKMSVKAVADAKPDIEAAMTKAVAATPDIAVVKVQPAWQSKTQLAQYIGMGFTILALFGLPVPEDVRAQVIAGGAAVIYVATWIIKRYSNTISSTAAQAMKQGA